jgi:hypothetical protein
MMVLVAFIAAFPGVIYREHQSLVASRASFSASAHSLRDRVTALEQKNAALEHEVLVRPRSTPTPSIPPVHVESGAAYAPNQSGGTVIGTVVGTVNTGPQAPQLFWESINSNVRNGETYDSTYMIHVVPAETIGVLRVDVGSTRKSLQHLDIFPLNGSGMTGTGNGSASNGAVVETLNAVTGDFRIRLVSTEPDYFDIKIGCAPVACSVTQQSH